nr:AtzE family amidohydrolase [uncultured Lichenicoccus sp.]
MSTWSPETTLDSPATDIADAVRGGCTKAAALIETTLTRIADRDPALNCFTTLFAETARAEAAKIDRAVKRGPDPGPLAGVPFAVKNLFDVAGTVTLAGSKIRRDAAPAAQDATLVARLRAAGAILIGCTNMDEFAYGFTTENEHDGPTHNPHDLARSAGGSSGGSAAAVAARMVPISLGSDTNGSIRVPASLCGIFGLKPTLGRLSRIGVYPFVDALDHVGPFARSVRDLAAAYDLLQGPDPDCHPPALEPSLPSLEAPAGTLRVGVLGGWFRETAGEEARAATDQVARALGAETQVVLDGVAEARAAAFCLTAASGAALHLQDLLRRPGDFDVATRARFLAGAMLPASVLHRVERIRLWFRDQLRHVFSSHDLLIAPATPCVAPLLGQPTLRLGDRDVPLRANLGIYTQPISFIGLPVVTVPVLTGGVLPIGVQLIAPPWREALALSVAAQLERDGIVGCFALMHEQTTRA